MFDAAAWRDGAIREFVGESVDVDVLTIHADQAVTVAGRPYPHVAHAQRIVVGEWSVPLDVVPEPGFSVSVLSYALSFPRPFISAFALVVTPTIAAALWRIRTFKNTARHSL